MVRLFFFPLFYHRGCDDNCLPTYSNWVRYRRGVDGGDDAEPHSEGQSENRLTTLFTYVILTNTLV